MHFYMLLTISIGLFHSCTSTPEHLKYNQSYSISNGSNSNFQYPSNLTETANFNVSFVNVGENKTEVNIKPTPEINFGRTSFSEGIIYKEFPTTALPQINNSSDFEKIKEYSTEHYFDETNYNKEYNQQTTSINGLTVLENSPQSEDLYSENDNKSSEITLLPSQSPFINNEDSEENNTESEEHKSTTELPDLGSYRLWVTQFRHSISEELLYTKADDNYDENYSNDDNDTYDVLFPDGTDDYSDFEEYHDSEPQLTYSSTERNLDGNFEKNDSNYIDLECYTEYKKVKCRISIMPVLEAIIDSIAKIWSKHELHQSSKSNETHIPASPSLSSSETPNGTSSALKPPITHEESEEGSGFEGSGSDLESGSGSGSGFHPIDDEY